MFGIEAELSIADAIHRSETRVELLGFGFQGGGALRLLFGIEATLPIIDRLDEASAEREAQTTAPVVRAYRSAIAFNVAFAVTASCGMSR
jgi:hypothetical protein